MIKDMPLRDKLSLTRRVFTYTMCEATIRERYHTAANLRVFIAGQFNLIYESFTFKCGGFVGVKCKVVLAKSFAVTANVINILT